MERLYPLLWRWHFVVGLLCAPFLLTLSITGALYAFQPQLEPVLEAEWQRLAPCADCQASAVSAQIAAAQAQYPGLELEHYGRYRDPSRSAVVFLKDAASDEHRMVWVNPYTLDVLGSRLETSGFFATVFHLHTRLLAGEPGRWLIELATSWVFVTLLMGLLLWWPRRAKKAGGWVPRVRSQGRRFWRDLHAVGGFYLLPVALVIVYTGLLFSPVAGKALLAEMALAGQIPDAFMSPPKVEAQPDQTPLGIDDLTTDFLEDAPAADWFISFPHEPGDPTVISVREALPWNTRIVYYNHYSGERLAELKWDGLAPGAKALLLFFPLHTGLILGWPTQVLAMLVALGLAGLVGSGIGMWWLRRRPGELGLPRLREVPRLGWFFYASLLLLAVAMPLFCISFLAVALGVWLARRFRSST